MVSVLTIAQKELLIDQAYDDGGSVFYPVQDKDGNWVISQEEVDQCTNEIFAWIKGLPQIPWNGPDPKIVRLF